MHCNTSTKIIMFLLVKIFFRKFDLYNQQGVYVYHTYFSVLNQVMMLYLQGKLYSVEYTVITVVLLKVR